MVYFTTGNDRYKWTYNYEELKYATSVSWVENDIMI